MRKTEPLDQQKLHNWKLLQDFRKRISQAKLNFQNTEAPKRGPERLLLEEDYFSLILFGMLNPILGSMRSLCASTKLQKVQAQVSRRQVSLGSFSEAQHVFSPEILKQVFYELLGEAQHADWGDSRLKDMKHQLMLVDGSLLPALPRMHWALWLNEENKAAKLHLKFAVLNQTASDALITPGNECERKTLKKFAKKGEIIVADRYYGLDYGYFHELSTIGASYVIRIRNSPKMEVVEELPLSKQDKQAGVTWQGLVNLGDKWKGEPIRVVRVEVDDKTLLLVTDLDIEAELVALMYRYRWQVELFFKWLKSILGCRHLIAESPEGVAIQLYSALIASLLLQAFTGKRPSKRAMELLQMYFAGYADLEEVMSLLGEKNSK